MEGAKRELRKRTGTGEYRAAARGLIAIRVGSPEPGDCRRRDAQSAARLIGRAVRSARFERLHELLPAREVLAQEGLEVGCAQERNLATDAHGPGAHFFGGSGCAHRG